MKIWTKIRKFMHSGTILMVSTCYCTWIIISRMIILDPGLDFWFNNCLV